MREHFETYRQGIRAGLTLAIASLPEEIDVEAEMVPSQEDLVAYACNQFRAEVIEGIYQKIEETT